MQVAVLYRESDCPMLLPSEVMSWIPRFRWLSCGGRENDRPGARESGCPVPDVSGCPVSDFLYPLVSEMQGFS